MRWLNTIDGSMKLLFVLSFFSDARGAECVRKVPTSLATRRRVRTLGATRVVGCRAIRHDDRDRESWADVRAEAHAACSVEPHDVRQGEVRWNWLSKVDT